METELVLTSKDDADFLRLTDQLMCEYVTLYGDEALEFCPAEAVDEVLCAVVAYHGDCPAASGSFRRFDTTTAELMRIYVLPEYRRQGLGAQVVHALESEAHRRGFSRMVLVTGDDMPDALSLYGRLGYTRIKSYGPHQYDPICVCMEKQLIE